MADESNAPPIIKRVKKADHTGHHGGAWKVAYADFVTAMMAFFLLLWLINATTEEQKRGIAEYFSPVPGAVGETTGGTGFFRGDTVTTDGKLVNSNAPVSVTIPIPTTSFDQDKTEGENEAKSAPDKATGQDDSDSSSSSASAAPDEAEAEKVVAEREEKQFKEAEYMLRQAIQNVPDLKELAENLIIDKTPEGLRIQLVDQEKYAMFPRGSSVMADKSRMLMQKVAEVIEKFPEKIAISGHTDSTAYADGKTYDNWDLSTDRANASRRALIDAGLPPARIVNLAGKADTEPLVKNDPSSPRNRRISIVLLREKALGKMGEADAASPADAAPGAPAPAPAQAPAPAPQAAPAAAPQQATKP
jgi:chemotaxis protein MotB